MREIQKKYLHSWQRESYLTNISKLIDRNTIDKICVNSSNPNEEGIKINDDQLKHLGKEEKESIIKIINKYKSFWATKKHQIGRFRGFKAEIELIDNAVAYQKERKISKNLEQGVKDTMSGLQKAGVFSLSTGEH